MSDVLRCGDHGGETADGSPCRRRVAEEGDRCPQHPREGEPAPAGRPRIEFTDDEVQTIEQLAGFGLTQEEVAMVVGVSEDTIRRRKQEDDEFLRAYARGRAEARARAAGRYHQIAYNRSAGLGLPEGEAVPVNQQRLALEKILESENWKDVQRLEHSGEIDTGGETHIYLPDNGRDEVPDPLKQRSAALAENGHRGNGAAE